ncbi:MAG: hypothetical protein ACPG1A_17455, partial [Halioglobus sp.]
AADSITMTATTAYDLNGVEYYFECTLGGGDDSGWQDSVSYTDVGLTPGTTYTYRVRARDKSSGQNVTAWSAGASATTEAPDTTAPTPDPMTFASAPVATGETTIAMTASTASDPSGVEYYFECTAGGGNDSGWQDGSSYTDSGLTPGAQYTYRVRARDKSPAQTETSWSGTASATTDVPDTVAPSPDPMTFASVPAATGSSSITMTATPASDPSGVEYYFECTVGGGNDSGWQDDTAFTDVGLDPDTEYAYRVRARDKSPAQTATGWSGAFAATTSASAPETLYRAAGGPIGWDTTSMEWSSVTGGPYSTDIWTGGDSAVFEGAPGTVTLAGPIGIQDLHFSTNSGYLIQG